MTNKSPSAIGWAVLIGLFSGASISANGNDPDQRAAQLVERMSSAELGVLVHGQMAIPFAGKSPPLQAEPGAGYVPGIDRLGIPALTETDASLGVAYVAGLRKDGATALPSGSALAASWNPDVLRAGGAMIASEARAKGFNVLLAGGVNLVREPRNGRTFEYLGEDPWLAGTLDAASIAGIQSQHVISTAKHFALNDQETARQVHDARISEAAARESDLLAFQIAIEQGQPGAIMCAYNQINGAWGCGNDRLLNGILKGDWGYKGFVMSDWGAVHALDYALKGLDQQSGEQLDTAIWLGAPLLEAAGKDPAYAARLKDMNRRVVRSMLAVGVDRFPPAMQPIDFVAHAQVARYAADEGIVLLRNRGVLPLDNQSIHKIAVIGGYSAFGVLSGGGSSQVHAEGGPAVYRPYGNEDRNSAFMGEQYHRSSPLDAIRALAPQAEVLYRRGWHIADAVAAARKSDVAIVFATQHMSEGFDVPELSLPDGQDGLIAAVAAANPRTIVVLETGGPVLMPWLASTAAVLEAWYPGIRGGESIADILFGKVNPSGRLPLTFPASEAQLPRPVLPGSDTIEPDFIGNVKVGQSLRIDYDIEGSDVGYRWFARQGLAPLFPFGYGLSYTTFETSALTIRSASDRLAANVTVRNTGDRAGADVVQIYLTSAAGKPMRRLLAYRKAPLAPGESANVTLDIDRRLLARWESGGWRIDAGAYSVAVGRSSMDLGPTVDVRLAAAHWTDRQAAGASGPAPSPVARK